MKNVSFDEIESKYSELTELNNSAKSNVYLVQSVVDGRIYIKKELKNYNIDVYKQIINIENFYMARVYEIFKCDDSLIVIEEFINGQTLQSILDNEGPLEETKAIKYMINLCSVLDILHNLNPAVIHRDIKPSNIIIDNNGILKLIDFDVSRVYKEERNRDTHILGTKGYASPEQFGFEQTDCRSDIYSVGVMLNVLITGKHIKEELNEGKLKRIIEKCTNISPDNRYSSVKELKEALEIVLIHDNEEKEISNNENSFLNEESVSNNLNKLYKKQKMNLNEFAEKEKLNLNKVDEKEKFNLDKIDEAERGNLNKKKKKFSIIAIIKDLPGYRRKNPLIILVASLWYFFLGFGLFCNWGTGDVSLMLEDLAMVVMLLSFTFLNGNYKNIKRKLPLIRSDKKGTSIAGIVIYNFIIFFIGGFLLEVI